jgi:hypothetical protein
MSDSDYNGRMRARLGASLIALVILVTGVIPAVGGYRCIAMGMRMQAPSACCRHESPGPTLKAQCCERTAAPKVEPRRTPSSTDTTIHPPTVIAVIVFPAIAPSISSLALGSPARARGRPPGEQLHLLSTILRV